MYTGTSTIDPCDRRAILVASPNGLRKFHLKATLALASSFFSLSRRRKQADPWARLLPLFSKLIQKMYINKSPSEILSEVEEILDLGVPLMIFDPSEAVRMFHFGVGHTPPDGTLYVQHPVILDAYINPSDFSRTVSKEKEAAFRQLASSLGAKKIILITTNLHTKKGLFGSTISIPQAAADIGIKVEVDKRGSLVKKVYSEYGEPRREPWVPPDLQPWVDMDADLRTMARDRIEGNMLRDTITLEFKEGIGVSGTIAAKVANKGLSLDSSYEAICHSVWYFDVEYYPIKN